MLIVLLCALKCMDVLLVDCLPPARRPACTYQLTVGKASAGYPSHTSALQFGGNASCDAQRSFLQVLLRAPEHVLSKGGAALLLELHAPRMPPQKQRAGAPANGKVGKEGSQRASEGA